MHTMITLFFIGLVIWLALTVFSTVATLFVAIVGGLIAGIVAIIKSIYDHLKGDL